MKIVNSLELQNQLDVAKAGFAAHTEIKVNAAALLRDAGNFCVGQRTGHRCGIATQHSNVDGIHTCGNGRAVIGQPIP